MPYKPLPASIAFGVIGVTELADEEIVQHNNVQIGTLFYKKVTM